MSNNPKRSGIQKWNLESVNWFHEALLEHGKDFEKISISMLKKSIRTNPQKIPNHLTSVGVRYFYYRNLRKASNLLHAYECRHPTAPGLAGVAPKKSVQNTFSGISVTTKRIFSMDQSESSRNISVPSAVIQENELEYADSTYSPSGYSLVPQVTKISADKRNQKSSSKHIPQVPTNANNSLTQLDSEESNLADVGNMITTSRHKTKGLFEENFQPHSIEIPNDQTNSANRAKCVERGKNDVRTELEEPSKRDLTKEWVQVEGLGRCSLDLIAVICYTKLHTILGEKINYRNKFLTHRITVYLGELVYKGVTKYRNRGHIKRIKLPNCKVLKTPTCNLESQKFKLQNESALETHTSGDSSGDEHPSSTTNISVLQKPKRSKFRVRKNFNASNKFITNSTESTQTEQSYLREQCHNSNDTICIEFLPKDELTYKIVQSIAHNPHLRIFALPSTFFVNIITLINTKWRKLFARSADLIIDFDFEFSDFQTTDVQDPSPQFLTQNCTVRELLISQINACPKSFNIDSSILRLKYKFCTSFEHVLSEGVGSQISPLSALIQLLITIHKSERKSTEIPIGKSFPRKFKALSDNLPLLNPKDNSKNVITRSLLKNTLEKLKQIHTSKHPLDISAITKIEQLKKMANRPNSSALKYLVEYLGDHDGKFRKTSKFANSKIRPQTRPTHLHKSIPKSKSVNNTFTRSVPSSFHSVLKEKATSRSLFSSEMTQNSTNNNKNFKLRPQTEIQKSIDEIPHDNVEPVHDEYYYRDPINCEYFPEFSGDNNQLGSLNTFSMLADAYFGLNDNSEPQETRTSANCNSNCPSVISENFQSLLYELDGMVDEWETNEVYPTRTDTTTNHTDIISNPAKMFLQYFLNSHESNSDDKVMRSIFEDDSLDGLGSQSIPYSHSNNKNNFVSNDRTTK